jgi:hypothetical protein
MGFYIIRKIEREKARPGTEPNLYVRISRRSPPNGGIGEFLSRNIRAISFHDGIGTWLVPIVYGVS